METPEVLKEALDTRELVLIEKIGEGGRGKVYTCFSQRYNKLFAMKICPTKTGLQEIKAFRNIYHTNIVNLYDYFSYGDNVFQLMEFCSGGDLYNYIALHGHVHGTQLKMYAKGILSALAALHSRDISHNDIKPENILIDSLGRPKIGDFGGCILKSDKNVRGQIGTIRNMAPEVFQKDNYDHFKADIWSLGVTFFFMTTGFMPFEDNGNIIKEIQETEIDFDLIEDSLFSDLIKQMLNRNHKERPTAAQALNHIFFAEDAPLPPIRTSYGPKLSKNQKNVRSLRNSHFIGGVNRNMMLFESFRKRYGNQ